MGLDLLDTPVRLTWDFPDSENSSGMVAIAEAVVDAGVFFVTLQGAPLKHPAFADTIEVLDGACQLMVTCGGTETELAGLSQLPSNTQLLLDTHDFVMPEEGVDVVRLQAVLEIIRAEKFNPSLSLTPLRSNLLQLPELIRFCSEQKVPRFKLPNAHIGDSFQQYSVDDLPRWQDLESFAVVWREFLQEGSELPAMDIHDLFLWEIMTPGQEKARSEYGGCQAGNSLAHVDIAGVVHPCSAWPQPLGRLPQQALSEVWAGPPRLAVVEEIANTPDGCNGCNDLDICFGGCRGLGKFINKQAGGRDLMCREPR